MCLIKKRGFGHVEAVLTLVIFIAFIIFAFIFFNPFRTNRTLTSTLDYSWREIDNYIKEDVDSYSVFFGPNAPLIITLAIPGAPIKSASVIDSSGNVINHFNNNMGVHFSKPADNFVVLQYSSNFSVGDFSVVGSLIPQADYIISSSESEKVVFEDKILALNKTYFSNYIAIKNQFNLPNRVEFGFVVQFSDGFKISALKDIPSGLEIQSKRDKIEVIRSSGKRDYAEVIVQVW
jgi:hypothetical protein